VKSDRRETGDVLRVWTIQPWAVWEQIAAQGAVTVDPPYTANLHHCYDWLQEQLIRHLPGYAGHYPWWAYCTRPDLRRVRHGQPCRERCALLELDLPRACVLTFPFWAWDLIFRGQFLSPSRRESEAWHRRLREAIPDEDKGILSEPWLTELEASWEQLFDPGLPDRGWSLDREPPVSEREAVFEVLRRNHIRKLIPFRGTSKTATPREMIWEGADIERIRGRAGGRVPRRSGLAAAADRPRE
jgi:hypothetical protein